MLSVCETEIDWDPIVPFAFLKRFPLSIMHLIFPGEIWTAKETNDINDQWWRNTRQRTQKSYILTQWTTSPHAVLAMILQGFVQTCFVLSSSEPERPTQLLSGQAPACSSSKMISTADLCNSSTLMALQMPCRRKSACLMLRRSPQSPVRLPSIWGGRIHLGGTARECKSQSPLVVLLCIIVYSMLFHCVFIYEQVLWSESDASKTSTEPDFPWITQ
jgi:hypothetical protein